MIILGINGSAALVGDNRFGIGFNAMHDAAAVLIDDGKIICAFEEERLNRIKHTNKFPILSIKACLERYNIDISQVDAFAFPSEEEVYDSVMEIFRRKDPSFTFASAREFICAFFKEHFNAEIRQDRIHFINHHFSHAASSYYVSGFQESLILALDGWGDNFSGGIYIGKENEIKTMAKITENNSIGNFYLEVTRLLGFEFFDEYKVMGLAPYGDKERYRSYFKSLYELKPDGQFEIYWNRFSEIKGRLPARDPGAPVDQCHKDLASALQNAIENIIFHIVKYYQQTTLQHNLCLAGGVSLNCTMTGKLLYPDFFREIFVQPASHDGGLPLGAALAVHYSKDKTGPRYKLKHVFFGNEFPGERACLKTFEKWGELISFRKSENITLEAATLIAAGNVIGWFQGASEYGPRALGNRSILADPRPYENKALINQKIKNREGFRPFAPSLIEDEVDRFFELPGNRRSFPFMTFILKVREEYRSKLGAVTHVDGTARLHTVSREAAPRYYELISCFGSITGFPVLLNTSFNNNHEPIVDTPEQAINCFLTTNLDYLIVGDFVITKKQFVSDDLYLSLRPVIPPFIKLHAEGADENTRFEIGNTYNKEKCHISRRMFSLLDTQDGSKSFNELLSALENKGSPDVSEVVEEMRHLWALRVIAVKP